MSTNYQFINIPTSRIATFDVFSIGLKKHHVSALLEFDVTVAREKLKELKHNGQKVSFNAWLLKCIALAIAKHPESAAFYYSKRKLITFADINISIMVEKEIGEKKVPIPLLIKKVNNKTIQDITLEIKNAQQQTLSKADIVLQEKANKYERLYYHFPGFIRRLFWKIMLRKPKFAYAKMGNAVVTSLNAVGRLNGWFIHRSIHPVSFGVGAIIKKPVVIENKVEIREILNMTILLDHDVIDGAPMVRFLNSLTSNIQNGIEL